MTTDDGLPHNEVMSMAQRPDGAMWLGTAGGLLRIEAEAVQMLLKRPERP